MNKIILQRAKVNTEHLPNTLPEIIKQIYAARGVSEPAQLELTANRLLPVESMFGLAQASDLILQTIKANKRIVIIGDFDADGATSTALMMEGLRLVGSNNHHFLVPNRFEYGYGLSPEIVLEAAKLNADLIITVDNGISCHQGVEKAKELGIKVIITDHHLPGKNLPDADVIVNPNQPACHFASKAIAGVGVAFYLILALRKYGREQNWFQAIGYPEPNVAQLLDLVALGTVADVVSLDANNRILVQQGLKRIQAGATRPGIQALIEVAKRNQSQLRASDFGFALGPRINAAGRLDDMAFGINCLLASDINTARTMATELEHLNQARREIEQSIQLEAEKVLTSLSLHTEQLPDAIALYQQDWHQGVIGIVAGRIKDKCHRPTIVFANAAEDGQSDEIKGSARSIKGVHIRDVLEQVHSQVPDLIIKFGGHAMAAGLTIKAQDFQRFQQVFNQVTANWLTAELKQASILSDGNLPNQYFTLAFAQTIQNSGPWGQAFPEPIFDDEFTLVQQRLVGEKHLKMVVEKNGQVYDAIAFNVDLTLWPNTNVTKVLLAYQLDINEFRGQQNLQLLVEYIQAL